MKILVNNNIIDKVLKPLKLQYQELGQYKLDGYKFSIDEYNRYYLEESTASNESAISVELSNDDIYKLDVFESALDFKKQSIIDKDIYAYFKVQKNSTSDILTIDDINKNFDANKGMNHCDLNLLIPCKTQKKCSFKDFNLYRHELSEMRAEGFKSIINSEFGSDYLKKINRYSFGEIVVLVEDDGVEYKARGFLEIAYHDDTRLCVLEIYIPNVSFGANKILGYYTSNNLKFRYNDKDCDLDTLFTDLHLRSFGRKRSMVFCDNKVSKQEIINTLANEEEPMGIIGGAFAENVDNGNIALYDTAKVYISIATMIEVCKNFEENYYNRYAYEVLETFFIELILLQDAAMDKIYKDLLNAQDKELKSKKNSSDIIDKISFDMSKAKRFADFESINFPTVRESAYKIAKKFGIEEVYRKYEENKSILQDMISANKREIEKHENEIKNNFLFLLSAISMYSSISGVIDEFVNNKMISYALSLIVVTLAYILYRYILKKYEDNIDNVQED